MIYSNKISNAISFSIETHELNQKQKRKGKDIAYITHPLTVGLILSRAGANEDTVVAGILHDTIEDSVPEHKVTSGVIEKHFGPYVAELVLSVTEEDRSLSWEARKQIALGHIQHFSNESVLVKSADVLSNVTELLADYEQDGDEVFMRFNAGKEVTIQNQKRVIEALLNRWSESPLAEDLKGLLTKLEKLTPPAEDGRRLIALVSTAEKSEDKIVKEFMGQVTQNIPASVGVMQKPTQCVLWNKPELVESCPLKDFFELIHTYVQESHLWRYLLKCRECGQLYFFEFYEEIDWVNGNDPQYTTFIPVDTIEESQRLNQFPPLELLQFSPRLQKDYPSNAQKPKISWKGKDA